jgi:hypothetical protein
VRARVLNSHRLHTASEGYSITINRKDESLETEYNVVPSPAQPTPADIIQKLKEKPINLEALFTGGNPFDETEPVTHNCDAEVNPDDVPF